MGRRFLLIDGHPDASRLSAHLLDLYQQALPAGTALDRIAIRDLDFDANLSRGYHDIPPLEPDLERAARLIQGCDHLVLAFPLWWGAEPARLKGFWDRILLPGRAFHYHEKDPWWDRLLAGRSADLMVTMDTPPPYLRLAYFDPIGWRYRRQVLGFVGFNPIRLNYFGPVRRGGAERSLPRWRARIARAASRALTTRPRKRILG
ncbi:NAD(P)H-dependent oxidoreductase [Paracoccus sp. (in: a-proteobacteria)]|uniref:NAD(P)H-dependent oxidoreductase n=1 Tax=Paracoccus sp. TaxID=267 RepID=UPI0035AEDEE8